MAFHQSLMVEVRDRGIFDVATNIENLINRKECANALYLADFLSGRPDPRLPRWWIDQDLFNHLATFQKAWRQEFKGVVGLDQSRRGKRLKVFVKEFVGFVLAVVSDHWHVDERRAHEKVFFSFLQFHPIHDVPCHLLGLFTFYFWRYWKVEEHLSPRGATFWMGDNPNIVRSHLWWNSVTIRDKFNLTLIFRTFSQWFWKPGVALISSGLDLKKLCLKDAP